MTDLLDGFDELSDQMQGQRAEQLRASGVLAGKRNPDEYGRANALADKLGLPTDVVADSLPDFEQQDRLDRAATAGQENPAFGDFLSDPRRMALAGDDVDGMANFASLITNPNARSPSWDAPALPNQPKSRMDVARTIVRQQRHADEQTANWQAEVEKNPAGVMDAFRAFGAAEWRGVGSAVRGVGGAWQVAYNKLVGDPASYLTGTDQTAGNIFGGMADAVSGVGERQAERTSAGYQQLQADNQIDGEVFSPSTWTFGDNPSVSGFMANGVDVMGSLAPIIVATMVSGGSTVVGAGVGGSMGGGAGMEQAADAIDRMAADGSLERESSVYRELIAADVSPSTALAITKRRAEEWAFTLTAPISTLGGAATAKILNPASSLLVGRGAAAQAAGRGGLGALEEAAQETSEGIASQVGTNLGAGTSLDPMEGSFGNAVLGAFGGAGPAAVAGAATARSEGHQRARKARNERLAILARSIDSAGSLAARTQAAAALKIGERSPADMEAFSREVGGDGFVYLRADQVQTLFQSEAVLSELVGGDELMAEQVLAGDFAIPLAKWDAVVSRLPNASEIVKHGRMRADDLSGAELESFDPDAELASLGYTPDTDAAAASAEPSTPDSRQQLQDDVFGQLTATGRYTPAAAEAQARLWSAAFARFGAASGQDPMTLYQRYMAGIGDGTNNAQATRPFQGSARMDALIESIRTADTANARQIFGPNLSSFLVAQGGLQDQGGELSARDASKLRPGLVSAAGLELDRARELAVERGYLPEDSDLNAFIDALDADLRGNSVYSEQEGNRERQGFELARQQMLDAISDNETLRDMPAEEFAKLTNQQILEALGGETLNQAANETPPTGGVSDSGPGIFQRAASAVRQLLQQPNPEGPRGQINIFPDRRMSIGLFEKADRSTFIHESGHFFLEVFRDIAAQPDASDKTKADFAALLDWFGVESGDQIETQHHEMFARGFEKYVGEGKAPSADLQSVFSQFKAWILSIYKSLINLNVELTDDVRGVFDRMLASDEEIEAAQGRQNMQPLARDANEAAAIGLTEKQFADYQAMLAAATDEAKAEVLAKLMKAHDRAREVWWKEETAVVRAEAEAEFEAMPVFRAARILAGAKTLPDGTPVPEAVAGMKLDKAALAAIYGEAYLKRLGRLYAVEGGVDQDNAAMLLGFTSGDALVKALANRGDLKARVDAETADRMRQRHGDPMTDGTLAEVAMDAVHNTKRVQLLEHELGFLSKLAGQERPNRRALKAVAQQVVAGKTSRQLRPNDYLAAERRAANEATRAAAKGDYAAALLAKRQQAFNVALYAAARDAQKRAESTTKYLRKAASDKTRERVGKQAGKHYVDALDAIFTGIEVGQASGREIARRASLRDWIRKMQEDGNNTAVSEELLARVESERVTNIADMTMTEVESLREAVENLLHLARVKDRLLTAKGERDWETAKADLVARLEEQDARHGRKGISAGDSSNFERVGELYAAGANWVLQPETIIEWLDAGTSGPFHDLLWEQSEAAEHTRERLNRMVGEKLQPALAALPAAERKALDRRYRIDSLDADISGHSILSALLNMGNAGNRDRLLRGGRVVGDTIVPFTETQLAEMFSKLSRPQAELVQEVWDAIDQLWPEIVTLEETLNGIAPERIEAQPFTAMTKDGPVSLRGGYYPAMYDPAGARIGQFSEDEQAKKVLSGQTPIRATTSKGHTEARSNFAAPLLLDYHSVLTRHLDGVVGDIAYRQFLQQVFKVLGDPDIRRMMDNRVGIGAAKGLQKAFERGATGNFSLAGPLFGPFQKAADATMTNLSSAALGFRLPLALANVVTAPILASARVSKRFLVRGFADYYGGGPNIIANMRTNARAIHALSPMMLKRSEARSVELSSIIANLRGKTGLRAAMIELAMSVHQWIVPLAENAIWLSAYKQAQAGGADMTESVRMADKAIRQTQTKHTAKDLAAAEGGYMRPLMMFAGPLVIINNRLQESGLRGLRGDVRNWKQALGVWIAMAAGGALVFELMMGRGAEDEDDDGEVGFDDWMQWAAIKTALLPFSAFPVIRDAAGYLDQGFARPMPLVDGMKSIIDFGKEAGEQAFAEEEPDPGALVTKATKAAGTVTGIPSNQLLRSGQYLMSVGAGERTIENPAAEAYYLTQGPPKDE